MCPPVRVHAVACPRMGTVEVYADVACPFAHVLLSQLVQRRAELDATSIGIVVRAWPLELIDAVPHDPEQIVAEVRALQASVAPELFRGFSTDRMPESTLPSMALTAAAYSRTPEAGEAVALRLRELLFEEGVDISDPVVLGALEASHGLHVAPDVSVVEAEWDLGRHRGVKGSPHVFAGEMSEFCPTFTVGRTQHDYVVEPTPWASDFLTGCFRR